MAPKGDNKGNKRQPKKPPKYTASFADPSVAPKQVYDPGSFDPLAAFEKYKRNAPPNIKRIIAKKKKYDSLNDRQKTKFLETHPDGPTTKREDDIYAAWIAKAPTKAPAVREEAAIGVAGGRIYDSKSGKFLGYTEDTQFQQYLPAKGSQEEQALNRAAQFLDPSKQAVQAPRYFAGEENKPASWSDPARRAELQTKLNAAHLYGGSNFTQGIWNEVDVQAYSSALAAANRAGVDVDTWLDQAAKAPYVEDADKVTPLTMHLARPEDIRQVANDTAKEIYGGYLPQSAIDQMVDLFHQQQIQAQQAEYATREPGGSYPDEPDVGTFVEQQIKQKYPNEVAATKFGNTFDSLIGQLTNPVA